MSVAPELVVEVRLPNDLAYATDQKVSDFLAAGTALAWVINPDAKTIAVHRLEGTSTILRDHDELSGDDILPGFVCRLAELFTMRPDAPTPSAPYDWFR